MKKILLLLSIFILCSCNWKNDENYKVLEPITIEVASDTINTNLGVNLKYSGLKVSSELETKYEWAYGKPKKGTSIQEHQFEKINIISDKPEIDYTFNKIGSYILRLKVDNGESIKVKYFTLNVNTGFDEGIMILSNADNGDAHLSFIKTLTSEEIEKGENDYYYDIFSSINPEYKLKSGTDIYISDHTGNYGSYSKLLIATNDENKRIYQLEAKTLEVLATSNMKDFGTYCKEFGGERASSKDFANYFIGADGVAYRYDMDLGFINKATELDVHFLHTFEGLFAKAKNKPSERTGIFYSNEYAGTRASATAGMKLIEEKGYEIINIGAKRIISGRENPFYVLMQNQSDKTSYKTKIGNNSFRQIKEGSQFNIKDLKMDRDSKIINTKESSFVYYNYNNAIYRWNLISAPTDKPIITLPEGEEIMDIATNFKGKGADVGGEDLLLIATYNPNKTSKLKGSVFVYQFSDNSLVKSYIDKFDKPISIKYKYRIN